MGRLRRNLFSALPYRTATRIAADLLASQGVGSGASLLSSGETRVFDRLRISSPVLIDAGGFTGGYTELFLNRFPRGRAFLFEPSAAHFTMAQQRLAGRPATCIQAALSDRQGTGTLHKDAEITGLASLTRRDLRHVGIEMSIAEDVRLETLDDFADSHSIGAVDLLKIDVEGHEFDVLKGAARLLGRRSVGLIQFEFGGTNLDTRVTFRDLWSFLVERRYAIHLVGPRRVQPLRKYRESMEQYTTTNYLAVLGSA